MKDFIIDSHQIPGESVVYFIFAPEKRKTAIGKALIIEDGRECLLWDIEIEPRYRKKGLASALLTGIKHNHDSIVTSWKSEAGNQMCLKNDFFYEESPSGKAKQLVWRREGAGKNNEDESQI